MSLQIIPPDEFTIHPLIYENAYPIGSLPLSDVLLNDDRRYIWLILVPRLQDISDISDLNDQAAQSLLQETQQALSVLKNVRKPDRIDLMASPDVTTQFHVDLIARFHSDEAWPLPVWNIGQKIFYPAHSAAILVDMLRSHFCKSGKDWISAKP